MRILYDYQAFLMQSHGGVSKCFVELISNLPDHVQFQIGIKESDNIYLEESGLVPNLCKCSKTVNNFIFNHNFRGKSRLFNWINANIHFYRSSLNINRNYAIELIKQTDYDVFHPTFFDPYFLNVLGNKPFVLTVHDMIPELFPQYYSTNDGQIINKRLLSQKASHIITVSEQTKKDLIRILHIPDDKISVVYHGSPINRGKFFPAIISGKYLLYVGGRFTYKNFLLFIKSFAEISQYYLDLKVVFTGEPFTKKEMKLIKSLNIYDRVIHLFVNDSQMCNLYQHATAFIYPSLYEGFGLPILEAFTNECPVLLNKKSCFPEIAGEAALYFCLDDFENTLSPILMDFLKHEEKYSGMLRKRGRERLKYFSWKDSANRLSAIYESVL